MKMTLSLRIQDFEPELKDILETPVESALRDLNQPNRNIEIVPFPGFVNLNTQPVVIHNTAKQKSTQNQTKQVTENGVWMKKGKTKTVKVTVNNNAHSNIKVLPDYPLTTVASDSKKELNSPRKQGLSPRKPTQYSKQMSESVYHPDTLPVVSRSPSPELDMNEVIIPGVEEAVDEVPVPQKAIPAPKQQHQSTIPKHPSIMKEAQVTISKQAPIVREMLDANKNVPNQNQPPALKSQPNPPGITNQRCKINK